MRKHTGGEPAIRSLKQRQREERQALILDAAHAMLIERGYHEASIDEIAARVGISKGTVYLHFASKEDLVSAVLEQQVGKFLALVDQVAGEATSVRSRLERILMYTFTSIQQERKMLLDMGNTIGLARGMIDEHPSLQSRVEQATLRMAELFEEGKRSGELAAALPTSVMLATFGGMLAMQSYEELLTSGQFSPEALVAFVSRILFQGVASEAAI